METIEKKVTDTILQRSSDTLEIDGNIYQIAPPTPATLILISEQIAEMPEVRIDTNNILFEVLNTARDCKVLGKIAATLILGAKRIKEHHRIKVGKIVPHRVFKWRKLRCVTECYRKETVEADELEHLSELLLDELTNQTLREVVTKRLNNMQISDFFGLTTSLSEANLLKRTKEVVTASGE